MILTSLDNLHVAITDLHNAGLSKIQIIKAVRNIARGFGVDVGLREAKNLVDAIALIDDWARPAAL